MQAPAFSDLQATKYWQTIRQRELQKADLSQTVKSKQNEKEELLH